jgi:hypothetical protein
MDPREYFSGRKNIRGQKLLESSPARLFHNAIHDRQQHLVGIFHGFICEQQKWDLHDVIRMRLVVGGEPISDNPSSASIVRAERSKFQFVFTQIPDGALLVALDRRAAGHADMSPARRMIREELGIDAHQYSGYLARTSMANDERRNNLEPSDRK